MVAKKIPVVGLLMGFAFLVSCLSYPAMAASELTEEQRNQITSQTNAIKLKPQSPLSAEEQKKPEIEIKKREEIPPQEKEGPVFVARKIRIEGSTLFKEKDFEPLTAPFINRPASFGKMEELARLLTDFYRTRGYATSQAYVPSQKIENGIVVLKVLEGRLGKVQVEDNHFFGDSVYLDALHLDSKKVFRYQDLESDLYFLNQSPDRKAKAYLETTKEPGTSDLILKAEETAPFHMAYEFNNRGTKLTHRGRQGLRLTHNNLSGKADILNAGVFLAEEGALSSGNAEYLFPIPKTGTTLQIGASHNASMLVKHLKASEIKGESWTITPGIVQRFVEKAAFIFEVFIGFEIKDSKTLVDDLKTNFDRMRVLVTGPRFTFQDSGGRTLLSGDTHLGFSHFLGGSDEVDAYASRPNSGGEFLYHTISLARVQRLPSSAFLLLRANGQWTKDNLTSLEQFRAGGAYSVRGYPEADSAGDTGYNASSELSVPFSLFGNERRFPFTQKKWAEVVRLVGFVDAAKTFTRQRAFPLTEVKDKFLLGTGFGIRVDLDRTFSLQTDIGFPIGDDSSDKQRSQVHFSVRAGF